MFWSDPPAAVGVHTEGNHQTPLQLVQIATPDYCLVEVPQNQTLSPHLQRLLDDTAIVKVFCEGRAHRNKKCPGLSQDSPAVVDLEALMVPVFGPFTNGRGLGRIVALCPPELSSSGTLLRAKCDCQPNPFGSTDHCSHVKRFRGSYCYRCLLLVLRSVRQRRIFCFLPDRFVNYFCVSICKQR
jgi:hypothetical protein